jgi:hypothetical protein
MLTLLRGRLQDGGKGPSSEALAHGRECSSDLFDNVARLVAKQVTRREAIKAAVKGMVALLVANVTSRVTGAQAMVCLCDGSAYSPQTQCCVSGALRPNWPSGSLAVCPNRTEREGHTRSPNGCGGTGWSEYAVPDNWGLVDFTGCCNDHDNCYETCRRDRGACDSLFGFCLSNRCTALPSDSFLRPICNRLASTYQQFVVDEGEPFWEGGQTTACNCCSDECESCPQGQILCSGVCCAPDEVCLNGACAPAPCSSNLAACGDGCCPEGFMCIDGHCESADLTILNPTFVQQGQAPYQPFGGPFIACGFDSVGLQQAPMRFRGPIPGDPSLPIGQTHGVLTVELPASVVFPRSGNLPSCRQPITLPAESLTFTLTRNGANNYFFTQGEIGSANFVIAGVTWCVEGVGFCQASPVRTNRVLLSFLRQETQSQPGFVVQRIFRYEGPPS